MKAQCSKLLWVELMEDEMDVLLKLMKDEKMNLLLALQID